MTMDSSVNNPAQQNRCNILLMGETGTGKSTLINYLTNYFRNGSLDNLKVAIPTKYHLATEAWTHSEKDLQDRTRSKTAKCTLYNFTKAGLQYNLIDTPGLGDTNGPDEDTENVLDIMATAEKTEAIAAVVLVINGSVARETVNLRGVLARLKSCIPDVLLDNLLVVLTNCSATSVNFQLGQLNPWTVSEKNVFYMNNSAFSRPVSDWANNEDIKEELRYEWKKSMKAIEIMITHIDQLARTTTDVFGRMYELRSKIKAKLCKILSDHKTLYAFQNELCVLQKAEKATADGIIAYSNYTTSSQIVMDVEHTSEFNIICNDCNKLCCSACQTANIFQMRWCHVFTSGSTCKNCGCGISSHKTAKYKPVISKVETIMPEEKAQFDMHTENKARIEHEIRNLNSSIISFKKQLNLETAKLRNCCKNLRKICSQYNLADELETTIAAMKADVRSLTSMEARADAEARIQNIQSIAASF